MAVHADRRRGDAGKCGCLYRSMTIATVDTESADVMIVTEWHRLLAHDILLSDVGRPVDRRDHPEKADQQKQYAEDAESRDGVRAAVKNLRHEAAGLPRALLISGNQTGLFTCPRSRSCIANATDVSVIEWWSSDQFAPSADRTSRIDNAAAATF